MSPVRSKTPPQTAGPTVGPNDKSEAGTGGTPTPPPAPSEWNDKNRQIWSAPIHEC